jgi:hypothetical protein
MMMITTVSMACGSAYDTRTYRMLGRWRSVGWS